MDLEGITKLMSMLEGLLKAKPKKAEFVFRYEPKDFPPCHTRIVRDGRGLPWNPRVAIHTTHEGHFEMKEVREPPKQLKPGKDQKRLK